jgi:HlyD family secretion protein
MAFNTHRWAIGAAAVGLIVASAAGWRYWHNAELPVYTVEQGPLVQTIVASGHVETPHRIDLGAQITGSVSAVPVKEGQRVVKGQVLVQLEAAELTAMLAQAEAARAQAEAKLRELVEVQRPVSALGVRQAQIALDNARRQLQRQRDLAAQGFVGQAALDDAGKALDLAQAQWDSALKQAESAGPSGSDFALAQANLRAAHTAVDAARARLGYATLAAPAAGLLIDRNVEAGDVVTPGRVLMTLSPDGLLQLVTQVDEKNIRLVALGQRAVASAEAFAERRFDAKVAYINPSVNAQTGALTVKLDVPEPPAGLQQDMTVSVNIEVRREPEALHLPVDAVHEAASSHPWVLKVREGRVQRVPVQLGTTAGLRVQIKAGLAMGDTVLTGQAKAADGARVRVRPASAP